MSCSLVLLCGSGVDPSPALAQLAPLRELFVEVLLSTPRPAELLAPHLPVVADRVAGAGAVAGLHAALLVARGSELLALAAAEPQRLTLVRRLVEHASGAKALLVQGDPLRLWPGRYRRGCLSALRAALQRGRVDAARLVRELHAAILP